uniref:Uncharacterized protein n=1 Tax=Utricularia reniformis TaxID=192314 RepID=A0A1Y0B1S1_9LAMI|nr:hypothetical protein AEK19_MT1179 [Utricularia reniformis]ART31392.1 hypothetical protein AEK19_MT1179 [Utricularia reniformis]
MYLSYYIDLYNPASKSSARANRLLCFGFLRPYLKCSLRNLHSQGRLKACRRIRRRMAFLSLHTTSVDS